MHFPVRMYPSLDEMSSSPDGSVGRSDSMIVQKKSLPMSRSTLLALSLADGMLSASMSGVRARRKASSVAGVVPR